VAYIKEEIIGTPVSMAWDMFGLLLHNLQTYQVIMHLVTMTASIQAIQLYRNARKASLKSPGFIPLNQGDAADQDMDRKSDIVMRSGWRKAAFGGASDRSRTIYSGALKPSTVK
jgi:hypothetical protein